MKNTITMQTNKTMALYGLCIALLFLTGISIGALFVQQNTISGLQTKLSTAKEMYAAEKHKANEAQKETEEEEITTLTKEYLVATDWGQSGPLGLQLTFHEDGTYEESFAGETGEGPVLGTYIVDGTTVALNPTHSLGTTVEELRSNGYTIPNKIYIFGETDQTLVFSRYLAHNGVIMVWDKGSRVPANSERIIGNRILLTIDAQATVTDDAVARNRAQEQAPAYTFFDNNSCPTCETQATLSLADVMSRVLARTQSKDLFGDEKEYWYLVSVDIPWYGRMMIEEKDAFTSTVWVHGSQITIDE